MKTGTRTQVPVPMTSAVRHLLDTDERSYGLPRTPRVLNLPYSIYMNNSKYPHLTSPIQLGKVTFRNRIFSAPMSTEARWRTASAEGDGRKGRTYREVSALLHLYGGAPSYLYPPLCRQSVDWS